MWLIPNKCSRNSPMLIMCMDSLATCVTMNQVSCSGKLEETVRRGFKRENVIIFWHLRLSQLQGQLRITGLLTSQWDFSHYISRHLFLLTSKPFRSQSQPHQAESTFPRASSHLLTQPSSFSSRICWQKPVSQNLRSRSLSGTTTNQIPSGVFETQRANRFGWESLNPTLFKFMWRKRWRMMVSSHIQWRRNPRWNQSWSIEEVEETLNEPWGPFHISQQNPKSFFSIQNPRHLMTCSRSHPSRSPPFLRQWFTPMSSWKATWPVHVMAPINFRVSQKKLEKTNWLFELTHWNIFKRDGRFYWQIKSQSSRLLVTQLPHITFFFAFSDEVLMFPPQTRRYVLLSLNVRAGQVITGVKLLASISSGNSFEIQLAVSDAVSHHFPLLIFLIPFDLILIINFCHFKQARARSEEHEILTPLASQVVKGGHEEGLTWFSVDFPSFGSVNCGKKKCQHTPTTISHCGSHPFLCAR